jgi:hypothetical protein
MEDLVESFQIFNELDLCELNPVPSLARSFAKIFFPL